MCDKNGILVYGYLGYVAFNPDKSIVRVGFGANVVCSAIGIEYSTLGKCILPYKLGALVYIGGILRKREHSTLGNVVKPLGNSVYGSNPVT